jgi:hypothetical protein
MVEILSDRRKAAPAEFMPPVWEWVDVSAEQASSEASINALQSTYADEIGKRGGSWRRNFYQRAKEERLKAELGLKTTTEKQVEQGNPAAQQADQPVATGELAGLSTQQFNRNRKAIGKVLDELATGQISEAAARVFLSGIGMRQESIDALITDALDGTVDTDLEAVNG